MDWDSIEEYNVDNPTDDVENVVTEKEESDSGGESPSNKRRRRSTTPVSRRRSRGELSSTEKKAEQRPKSFQDGWLENEEFKGWLEKVPGDTERARCKACNSVFKAGKSEVEKHASGLKHQKRVKSLSKNHTLDTLLEQQNAARKHSENVKVAEIKLASFLWTVM